MNEYSALHLTAILEAQNPWWTDGGARRARNRPVARDLLGTLLKHVSVGRERRAAVVMGPRQVGKTTLLLQIADRVLDDGWPPQNLTYFDFDDDRLVERPTAREIAERMPVGKDDRFPQVLLLDEIERAPRWDLWLKNAVDAGAWRIIATDSAASILREKGRESGLGRWDEHRLETLSFREYLRFRGRDGETGDETLRRLPDAIERFLGLGGFPEYVFADDYPAARERLRRDVADRAIRRDLSGLVGRGLDSERVVRLLNYVIQESGGIFDAQARARDLDADPRTIREWIGRLEDTMLVVRLEPYGRSAAAHLRSNPRYHAADPGLIAAYAPLSDPLSDAGVRGRICESVVYRHLRALQEAVTRIGYFRRDGLEIDFVVARDSMAAAIEVTSSGSLRREKLKRFQQAREALGVERGVLIHGGPVSEARGSLVSLSLADFLMNPEKVMA